MTDLHWEHASLSLDQPGWPGVKKAEWVAATSTGHLFRERDLVTALDRLGADGWELATFVPEWSDRDATFVFKRASSGGS